MIYDESDISQSIPFRLVPTSLSNTKQNTAVQEIVEHRKTPEKLRQKDKIKDMEKISILENLLTDDRAKISVFLLSSRSVSGTSKEIKSLFS